MILELTLAGGLIAASATAVTLALQRGSDARSRAVVDIERQRLALQLDVTTKAYNESQRRIRKLSEALRVQMARPSGLAADDVDGRMRLLEIAFSVDDPDGDAAAVDTVSLGAPAAAPNVAALPSGSATVR